MDNLTADLDELMGKDRNHPLHIRLKKRDHFDDDDVCKSTILILRIKDNIQFLSIEYLRFL